MKNLVLILLAIHIGNPAHAEIPSEFAAIPVYQTVYEGPPAQVGPVNARLILTMQSVEIEYTGMLAVQGAELGVVQDGTLVDYFPLTQNRGVSQSAHIPIRVVHSGPVQFFVKSFNGQYDSSYGQNFSFVLKNSN